MENIEIEIKLKLDNPSILLEWLKNNAELIKTSNQTDYYFDPPHKTYIYDNKFDGTKDADEWFRIRVSDKGNEICYKKWHRKPETGESTHADEIETMIGNEKQMLIILEKLGFKPTSTIKKHRNSYKYKNFQFDCDEVENIGFFVEIEFQGELEDPAQGKQIILDLLKEIGINDWKKTKRGYSWIQWNPGIEHFEDF